MILNLSARELTFRSLACDGQLTSSALIPRLQILIYEMTSGTMLTPRRV